MGLARTPFSKTLTRSMAFRSSNTILMSLPTTTTSLTLFGSAQLTWIWANFPPG